MGVLDPGHSPGSMERQQPGNQQDPRAQGRQTVVNGATVGKAAERGFGTPLDPAGVGGQGDGQPGLVQRQIHRLPDAQAQAVLLGHAL